jgi:hypothetical protein
MTDTIACLILTISSYHIATISSIVFQTFTEASGEGSIPDRKVEIEFETITAKPEAKLKYSSHLFDDGSGDDFGSG